MIIKVEEINESIKVDTPVDMLGCMELHSIVNGVKYYTGTIWDIKCIEVNKNKMLIANITTSTPDIMLHNIRDIQIYNSTESVKKYIVNIEY